VVKAGTGAAASSLKHPLGGKTGTTNDYTDAWFIGFSPSITCGTWIGFDDRQSLGSKETGAKAALPMWMDFMRVAIASKPDETFPSATAPKKVLEVPLTPEAAPVPAAKPMEDADPDAPEGEDAAPKVNKAAPAPVAPEGAPVVPAPVPAPSGAAAPVARPAPVVRQAPVPPGKAGGGETRGVSVPPPE
jgi:penicillin-binding protein 1A